MGGTVVFKELSEPIFLSTLNDKSLIVVSAIGRYPFLLSTDGLLNNLNEQITLKEKDRIMALDETYSAIKISSLLLSLNKKSVSLGIEEAAIVSNSNFTKAKFVRFDYSYILKYISNYDCVVVPGFIARDEFYHSTTLGRENSDLSAILYAKYLGVKNVDFIKDIDGVKDEKDNVLLENKFINEISYEKALEKALLNKMPISYDAIVLAKEFDIKISIKNRENSLLCIIK